MATHGRVATLRRGAHSGKGISGVASDILIMSPLKQWWCLWPAANACTSATPSLPTKNVVLTEEGDLASLSNKGVTIPRWPLHRKIRHLISLLKPLPPYPPLKTLPVVLCLIDKDS